MSNRGKRKKTKSSTDDGDIEFKPKRRCTNKDNEIGRKDIDRRFDELDDITESEFTHSVHSQHVFVQDSISASFFKSSEQQYCDVLKPEYVPRETTSSSISPSNTKSTYCETTTAKIKQIDTVTKNVDQMEFHTQTSKSTTKDSALEDRAVVKSKVISRRSKVRGTRSSRCRRQKDKERKRLIRAEAKNILDDTEDITADTNTSYCEYETSVPVESDDDCVNENTTEEEWNRIKERMKANLDAYYVSKYCLNVNRESHCIDPDGKTTKPSESDNFNERSEQKFCHVSKQEYEFTATRSTTKTPSDMKSTDCKTIEATIWQIGTATKGNQNLQQIQDLNLDQVEYNTHTSKSTSKDSAMEDCAVVKSKVVSRRSKVRRARSSGCRRQKDKERKRLIRAEAKNILDDTEDITADTNTSYCEDETSVPVESDDDCVNENTTEEEWNRIKERMKANLDAYYVSKYCLNVNRESHCIDPDDKTSNVLESDNMNKCSQSNIHVLYKVSSTDFVNNIDFTNRKVNNSESYRQRHRLYQKNRYDQYPEYREKKKLAYRMRYNQDYLCRYRKQLYTRQRYNTCSEYQTALKNASRLKYRINSQYRQQLKVSGIYRYRNNILFRKLRKLSSIRKYKNNMQHRKNVKAQSILKYQTSFKHRQRIKGHDQFKYTECASYRQRKKERLHCAYKMDVNVRTKKLKLVQTRRKKQQKDKSDIATFFKQSVRDGPQYICCVCHKFKFRKQVVVCTAAKYDRKGRQAQVMARRCITHKYSSACTSNCNENCENIDHGKLWICYTCHTNLLKGQMPADAAANNLQLQDIPGTLRNLNNLERQLISLRIPFMKLVRLPKGGQRGVIGPCVSVPTDIQKITQVLPRSSQDSELIKVKLKRKLPYKGHYMYEYVNPAKVQKGLQYLKENNVWYRDVSYNETWQTPIEETTVLEKQSSSEQQQGPGNGVIESIPVPGNSDNNQQQQFSTTTSENKSKNDQDSDTEDDDPIIKYKGLPADTCLQPVDIGQEVLDQYFDGIYCIAPGEGNTPVSMLKEDGNEAMSFPAQFPNGLATYSDERPVHLSRTRYFHSRLFNADNRFASDSQYIFYAQYLAELEQVVSKVSIALRKGTTKDQYGKQITADMLTDGSNLKNLLNTDQGYKFMTPIRGTPPYWQSTLKDLFAMIRQLGIPTWFCTFSAADLRWKEILEILMKQQGDTRSPDDLDWLQKCQVLQDNSIMNAVAFDHRFHTLLKNIIIDKEVIGKVKDHFHRIEFQQRGSPHSHCLFWIQDAPSLDQDDDDSVCAFVDQYVTCKLPDEQQDPELHEIVSSVQQHSKGHSKSCRKKGSTCRFHFPRPPSNRTFISRPQSLTDPSTSDLSPEQMINHAKETLKTLWDVINNTDIQEITTQNLFKLAGITQVQFEEASNILTKRSSVVLERRPLDSWINQYNPTLLRCWNANMDIQYVSDAYSCVMYIISYISKAEREMGIILEDARKEAADGNLDAQQAMKKIGSAYFHQREVSSQEAAYRVCGLHLKECSRKVQFVPVGNNEIKMSKPLHLIKSKSKEMDSDDIWMPSIYDRYKARPLTKDFDSICLASFCSEYRILATSQVPQDISKASNVHKLQNNLGFIRKRSRTEAAVVRYPRFSQKKDSELYHKSILQLFLPHRNDKQLKPTSFNTYEEFFTTGAVKLSPSSETASVKSVVESNQQLFEHNVHALDEAEEMMQKMGPLEDAWAMISPESELSRLECNQERQKPTAEEEEQLEIPDLDSTHTSQNIDHHIEMSDSIITAEEAIPLIQSLNTKQKQIFYKIRQWCLDKVNGKNPEPFRLFISGGAGTGKSHLIKCLHYQAHKILSPAASNPDDTVVLLTAPTGTAAFNIGGTTLHRAFSLPQYMSLSYQHLTDEKLNTLRCKLQSLNILIIDEISMVGQEMMLYVHERLRQIKQSGNALFGNICVIAVGDFFQLPPVKQKRLYDLRPKNYFSLWTLHFTLVELEEIMRQRDDKSFAELLNRIRVRSKEDQLDADDFNCLQACQNKSYDYDTLHIFATNAEVETHNRNTLEKVCSSYQTISAEDYDRDPRTSRLTKKQTPYPTTTDNLPFELLLGKGARVMLTRNVDVTDGLVNGVVGTVHDILPPLPGSLTPSGISVIFDNKKIGTKTRKTLQTSSADSNAVVIKSVEETLSNNAVRLQFPLRLAWACTVHKVQGITTHKLVVSFSKIFAPGMAYVALSRVTSIDGLAIQDFDAKKIYCTAQVSESLQQMEPFLTQPATNFKLPNTINLLIHNIQGLLPHICDLKANTDVTDSHFICLVETWLGKDKNAVKPSLADYNFHHVPRSSSYKSSSRMFKLLKQQKCGGVGVFTRYDRNFQQVHFATSNMEVIAFHISDIHTTVIVIYRPEAYTSSVFIQHLQQLIEELPDDDTAKLIIGDFNQNLLKSNTAIRDFMDKHGYKQLVDSPTTDGDTLIDHVYLRGHLNVAVNILPTYYSYHNMISLNLQLL